MLKRLRTKVLAAIGTALLMLYVISLKFEKQSNLSIQKEYQRSERENGKYSLLNKRDHISKKMQGEVPVLEIEKKRLESLNINQQKIGEKVSLNKGKTFDLVIKKSNHNDEWKNSFKSIEVSLSNGISEANFLMKNKKNAIGFRSAKHTGQRKFIEKKNENYQNKQTKKNHFASEQNNHYANEAEKKMRRKKEKKIKVMTEVIKECPKWKTERQDWTINYYGNEAEYNNTKCPKPIIVENVKRIIFKDGSFLNTGCSNKTKKCKQHPFYDFKNEIRINTPPCCRHHILKMLEHVTVELTKQGVSHSMISGGVIGWARNKKMIPYDRDLDIILHINYWNTTKFWQMFANLHAKYGYVVDNVEDFKLKLYFSKHNKNDIDIWAYWSDNNTISIAYHGFKEQQVDTMLPFQSVKFEWFQTFIPAKPIKYLNEQYGKEVWKPEKQCMVRNSEGDCW